jgi:acetyl esterase/lipase
MGAESGERFWYEPVRSYVYKETRQGPLSVHVHYPFDLQPGDRRPAILLFFGGAWKGGTVAQFARQATYLASRGMVAARADYRVQSRHGVTAERCVEDAKSALRWLRARAAQLGVDPARVVGSGGSAGGHLAAAAALVEDYDAEGDDLSVSPRPDALLLFNPVLRVVPRHIGDTVPDEETGRRLSPLLHLRADAPPTLLLFGGADEWLGPARAYVARAASLGCHVELDVAMGAGHGFFNEPPWFERTLQRADQFLASLGYLVGAPTTTLQPEEAQAQGGPP